jgi:hypothetical protein
MERLDNLNCQKNRVDQNFDENSTHPTHEKEKKNADNSEIRTGKL